MREFKAVAPSRTLVLAWCLTAWAAAGCAAPVSASAEQPVTRAAPLAVAVYALSRGRGLPDATRDALMAIREMLKEAHRQGTVTRLDDIKIGIEGERRLCAEFSDPAHAREFLAWARRRGHNVELLNIVEEPCSRQ